MITKQKGKFTRAINTEIEPGSKPALMQDAAKHKGAHTLTKVSELFQAAVDELKNQEPGVHIAQANNLPTALLSLQAGEAAGAERKPASIGLAVEKGVVRSVNIEGGILKRNPEGEYIIQSGDGIASLLNDSFNSAQMSKFVTEYILENNAKKKFTITACGTDKNGQQIVMEAPEKGISYLEMCQMFTSPAAQSAGKPSLENVNEGIQYNQPFSSPVYNPDVKKDSPRIK